MMNAVIDYVEYGKRILKLIIGFHLKVVNYKKLLFRLWEKYYPVIIPDLVDVKLDIASQRDPSLAKRQK